MITFMKTLKIKTKRGKIPFKGFKMMKNIRLINMEYRKKVEYFDDSKWFTRRKRDSINWMKKHLKYNLFKHVKKNRKYEILILSNEIIIFSKPTINNLDYKDFYTEEYRIRKISDKWKLKKYIKRNGLLEDIEIKEYK